MFGKVNVDVRKILVLLAICQYKRLNMFYENNKTLANIFYSQYSPNILRSLQNDFTVHWNDQFAPYFLPLFATKVFLVAFSQNGQFDI